MTVLREDDLDEFLSRKVKSMNGLLVHGADEAAVNLVGSQAIKKIGVEARRLDVSACKSSASNFLNSFLSLPMFGDRETLLLDDADEACLGFLEPAFAQNIVANFSVILCSALGKTSKLRAAAEESKLFACLAIYEQDEAKLRARIQSILSSNGLSWGADAEDQFYAAVGGDRALVTGEAEKLALYANGQAKISVADVRAICGDTAEFDVSDLTDAILGGDLERTDHITNTMGADVRNFLPLFNLHISRLQSLAVEIERGVTVDTAVRNAKPPIFFKRKFAITDQVKRIALQQMINIQFAIQEAILLSRKNSDLSAAIVNRTLLAIARQCKARISS